MNAIIIGGGQVGSYIAGLLLESNCHVRIIEPRESVFNKLKNELPLETLIIGGGTDPATMEQAGIEKADVVVAVTGADEINLVASTIAKYEFGVPRVIARVNNPKNEWLFNAGMGVDVKFNQANILARLVVDEIDFKNMITLLKLNKGDYSIIQVTVAASSPAAGKAVKDLSLSGEVLLIAIHRGDEILLPRGETQIQQGDHILVFADDQGQVFANRLFGE
ncbi:MAG: potassium channel family protein [Oscillospiraceae bacterium]